jgi:hypothetical protein
LACERLEDRLLLTALPIYSTFDQLAWADHAPMTGGLNQPSAITVPTGGSVTVGHAGVSSNGLTSQPVVISDLSNANYGSVDYDFDPVTSGKLRADVTVSIFSNSRSHLVDGYFLQIGDGSNVLARLRMSSSGQITDDAYHVLGNYQANVPFRVRVTVSPAEHSWSVVVDKEMDGFDNNSPYTGLLYSGDKVSRLSASLYTTVGASATSIAYDNIEISTLSDLAVTNVRPLYCDSGFLEYQYTVTNIGDSPADLEGPTGADTDNVTIQGILSADDVLGNADDVPAGTDVLRGDRLGQLEAGQSVSGTVNVLASVAATRPYVFVRVDPGKLVPEVNDESNGTDNNVTRAQIPVASQLPVLSTFDHESTGARPETDGLNQPTDVTPTLNTAGSWVMVKSSSSGLSGNVAEIGNNGAVPGTMTYAFDNVWHGLLRIEATVSFSTLVASSFLGTADFVNTSVTRLYTSAGGSIYYTYSSGGTAYTKDIGTYSANTPFRMRMDIDLSARTWSFTQDPEFDGFDDNTAYTGLFFTSASATQIDKVQAAFAPAAGSALTTMAYDDLVITRPDLVVSDLRPVAYDGNWVQYQYTVTNTGGAPANLNGIGAAGNEVQRFAFTTVPTGGSYAILFNPEGSGGSPANTQFGWLPFSAPASEVERVLRQMTTIGTGNVRVTGSYTTGFTVNFYGASLGRRDLVDSVILIYTPTLTSATGTVDYTLQELVNGFPLSNTLDDVRIQAWLSSDSTFGNTDDVALSSDTLVRTTPIVLDPGESITLLYQSQAASGTESQRNFMMRVGCVADTSGVANPAYVATRLETDETNNTTTSRVPLDGTLDLSGQLCKVTATSALVWGQTFTVQYQVHNAGTGRLTSDVEQWFILSTDQSYTAAYAFDPVVLSDDISAGGDSSIRTVQLTLPTTPPTGFSDSGTLYLSMLTDLHNNAVETDETNNGPFTAGLEQDYDTLDVATGPDLVGGGVTAPATLNWNQKFSVSCTVTDANNVGVSGTFAQGIYLSQDTTFGNSDDLYLGAVSYTGAGLGTAQSGWIQMPAAAPAGYTGAGPFYLYMATDAGNAVVESSEVNNRPGAYGEDTNSARFSVVSVDLRGAACDAPSALAWGQPFDVSYQVRNDGTTAVGSSLVQRFYLSKDATFGNIDDYSLGTDTYTGGVPASGSGSIQTAQLQMPPLAAELQLQFAGVPNSGTYTLTFDLDGAGTTYAPQTTGTLNYNASYAEIELALESLLTIGHDNVEVRGAYDNLLTFAFDLDLARSDMTLTVDTAALSSASGAVTGTLSPVFGGSGPYYIAMVTDDGMVYGGAVGESNEANNAPFSYALGVDNDSFAISSNLPELQGAQCYPPVKIQWGESFLVNYQIANNGSAAVTDDIYQAFYLSKDQVFGNSDDVYLGGEYCTTDIAGNSRTSLRSINLTLPASAPTGYSEDGPFYIGMSTDAYGKVWESNESNNTPFSSALGADWQFFYIGEGGGTPVGSSPDTPGLYNPATSWFYLRDENVTGVADYSFGYGAPHGGWTVLTGDWDGNGTTGVGLYDPQTSTFYLTSAYQTGVAEYTFGYGEGGKGWIPIVGDWDGDGADGVGLFDPQHSVFYLTDSLTYGYASHAFGYGDPGGNWTPMVGDWNGDGADGVGLYNPRTSTFYLTSAFQSGYAEHTFGYGQPEGGWQPLVGDWNGDRADGVGLYNPTASTFYLTSTFATGYAEFTFGYGEPNKGWQPLVGDWNGDGTSGVGLYAPSSSTFYLTNTLLSGYAETTVGFGQAGAGMVAFVGCWEATGSVSTVAVQSTPAAVQSSTINPAAVDQIDLAGVAALQAAETSKTEPSLDEATDVDSALAIDLALSQL